MKTKLCLAILLLAPTIASAMCPLPPLPPLGCKVGPCVCDQRGQNCQYQMLCK